MRRHVTGPYARVKGPKPRRRTELGLLIFGSALVAVGYGIATIQTTAKTPGNLGIFLGIVLALGLIAHVANRYLAPDANPVLLPLVVLLNGLGYMMIARLDPHLAKLQAAWSAVSVVFYVLTLLLVRRSRDLDRYRYVLLLAGAALLLSPLVPHLGENINGARLWVKLGPVSGQPVEIAKIALVVFFASYFAEKRELLSIASVRIGNRLVIDPRPLGPIVLAWLFAMAILASENDLGFTLMIFVLFLLMLWLASGRIRWIAIGLGMFALGAFVLHSTHHFTQFNTRVSCWLDPWKPSSYCGPTGQIAQAQYSFGNGGLLGVGLGQGYWGPPKGLAFSGSELSTDYIFAAFGEEMGLIGTATLVAGFLLLVGAGLHIAQKARWSTPSSPPPVSPPPSACSR